MEIFKSISCSNNDNNLFIGVVMFTESDFKELLGIKNIEITKTEIDSEGNFLIYVKSTNQEILCRLCGKETLYHHGLAQPVRLRHLPMCNRITYLSHRAETRKM